MTAEHHEEGNGSAAPHCVVKIPNNGTTIRFTANQKFMHGFCPASMTMEQIDKGHTLMHLSGQILNERMPPLLEPYVSEKGKTDLSDHEEDRQKRSR